MKVKLSQKSQLSTKLGIVGDCESWTVKKAECRIIDALNCGVGEDS